MRWRGKALDTGRRTAATPDELIRQIAADKAINRFSPRPSGVEVPRDVFTATVTRVADHFPGWRYAKSGPHLSRRQGDVSAKIAFVSNRLNVAGELVGLWVDIHLADHTMGKWRREIGSPLVLGNEVARRHLGHLLDPPQWLEWNLAERRIRTAAIADIVATIEGAAMPWIESVASSIQDGCPDPSSVADYVTQASLIEYLVRAEKDNDAAAVIRRALARAPEHARSVFADRLSAFRVDLPATPPGGGPALLAYAAARFDLAVDPGAL